MTPKRPGDRVKTDRREATTLARLTMPEPAPHIALQEYLATVEEAEQRVTRLTEQLRQLVPLWR